MKKNILLFLSVLMLAGCAGTYFTFDKARQVQVGMTEAEVQQLMGKPNTVVASSGQVKWIYSYGTGLGSARAVSYVFKDGKVTEIPSIPASFK